MLYLIALGVLAICFANIADNLFPPRSRPSFQRARASERSGLEDATTVPKVVTETDRELIRQGRDVRARNSRGGRRPETDPQPSVGRDKVAARN
jgi:hypothetical protein